MSRWESEEVMHREHEPMSAGFSLPPVFEGPGHRTVPSYERALREHRLTEIRPREAPTRDTALLRQMDELIQRQKVLNQECDHRLQNNLQMVVGLLSLQSRTETNSEVAGRLSIAANRVATIARIHRHLHSMDGAQTVAFKGYLDDLCRNYSAMLIPEERPDQVIVVEGTEAELPTAIGSPLSLIVNELVTNAIKHGVGMITVKLEALPGSGCALSVCNGRPALPEGFDPTACNGLGLHLVLSLAAQIGGELRIDRGDTGEGARFTVLFTR